MTVRIFTDGGARGNPGPAGAGAIIYNNDAEVGTVSKYLGVQTNNLAEYEALILALEKAQTIEGINLDEVEVCMDSELIVKQMKKEYRVKDAKLKLQYAKVEKIIADSFPHISFVHVRREQNTEADQLANDAMDRMS